MKLAELPDDFTREQFMQLHKESLDAVPFVRLKWLCSWRGCNNGTHVRDYGLVEFNPRGIWLFLDRNSKYAAKNPREYWRGPNNYWLCGKHWRFYERLQKSFEFDRIFSKFIDCEKIVLIPAGGDKIDVVKQIEKAGKRGSDRNASDTFS